MASPKPLLEKAQLACVQGDWRLAKRLFVVALQDVNQRKAALHGLGVVSLQAEQTLRAVVLLERAQMLQSENAPQHSSLIEALVFALNAAQAQSILKRKWNLALRLGKRSLALQPLQSNTLSNLAVTALRTNQLSQAMTWSQLAVELEPTNNKVLNNHATILQEQDRLQSARDIYNLILEKDPKHPHARSNLGCLEHQTGHLNKAAKLYKEHLKIHPSDTRTWVNLAGTLLSQNNWKQGWDAYQYRLNNPEPIMKVPKNLKLWQHVEQPVGALIVVHEQGLGDCFQFSRYLSALPKHLNHVIFSGPKKLFGLLKQSRLIETCWDPEDPDFNWHERGLKNEDRWIPLMSLAPLLHTKQEIECFNSPYLQAKRESIRRWDKILKLSHQQPLIGLHWQGNPEHEMTLSRGRSIALRQLELLLDVEGAQWLSLQKGPGSDQLDSLQWRDRFHPKQSLVDDCWDFQETAGILMNCDLVITSDSGLAHLAAGLGRPTWLLLMHVPEWRWGLKGSSSPWYPSMRLFRQQARNDWSGLIQQQVRPALEQWLKQKQFSHQG